MIIANWKCNGSKAMIIEWFNNFSLNCEEIHKTFVGIAPPSIFIENINNIISSNFEEINIGSQDIDISSGARTGAISSEMIIDFDCKFSIVGHSERREFFNENNKDIKQKILNIANKTKTILCIGETFEENKKNLTKEVLINQLEVIKDIHFDDSLIIAYEPVWAIGSGQTPEPKEINEIHKYIKDVVQSNSANNLIPKVLYGGSVTDKNAESFFVEEFVDGALVGGASLDGSTFAKIVNIFNSTK